MRGMVMRVREKRRQSDHERHGRCSEIRRLRDVKHERREAQDIRRASRQRHADRCDECCLHQESAGRRRQSDHERHGRCSEMPRPRDVKLTAEKRKTNAEHRDSVMKIARTSADCVMRVRVCQRQSDHERHGRCSEMRRLRACTRERVQELQQRP